MVASDKTIRRDLELFQELGFPVEEEVGQYGRKRWRVATDWAERGLGFTFDEALALYLGHRFLAPLTGTMFGQAAHNAFRKIRASLGESALRYMEKMAGALHSTSVGVSDYSAQGECIDCLLMGIEDRRAVAIVYRSQRATEPVTYLVHPYGLTYHRGSLYLVGYSEDHEELRHWKVDRIEQAELEKVHFQRPEDFDLSRHFADSFGVWSGRGDIRVKVRFAADAARYVREKKWHESQRLTTQGDGSLIVRFRLSDTREIKSWVLSFGAAAEILEPAELREEVAAELRNLLARYDAARDGAARAKPPIG